MHCMASKEIMIHDYCMLTDHVDRALVVMLSFYVSQKKNVKLLRQHFVFFFYFLVKATQGNRMGTLFTSTAPPRRHT
jgi:hypothetical protein